jgi:phosphoribosylformylglycinamidine synthase II/phosphoribosylformylglycinamidine synthase I
LPEAPLTLLESVVFTMPVFRVEVVSYNTNATNQKPERSQLYFLNGDLNAQQVSALAEILLADPVSETFTIEQIDHEGKILDTDYSPSATSSTAHFVDVALLPGVTDSVAENIIHSAHMLGFCGLKQAATGHCYHFHSPLDDNALTQTANRLFNPVNQRAAIDRPIAPPFVPVQAVDSRVEIIVVRNVDDTELVRISTLRRLALDLPEMQAIQNYFQQEDRDPTDAELEMIAQTWSEHCFHKTFKAAIDYSGPLPGASPASAPVIQHIDGLLNTYIRAATNRIAKPWVRSAFVDNAGIIAFDETYDLALKVETHNHPSALEPFGGANTGVGGVVRDILGVSARPIANTDVLCFGPPHLPDSDVPAGVLPPRRIAEGVVHGVEDYGNKMGIPTVNGAIHYHPGYTANPLVFCGCLGLLPHGTHPVGAHPGDLIVVIGGRTGRDGLRGATFSSMEMDTTTSDIAGSSVQIGHPINEKQVQEALLRLRDQCLYNAITDCGAGGLSSAVGEMAAELGGRIQLETVPLKYAGLRPWEIWLSEAQERMVLAVPPQHWERVQEICAGQNVEATCIGEFQDSGRLLLNYEDVFVGNLSIRFLHDGHPRRHLQAEWSKPEFTPFIAPKDDYSQILLDLLAHPTIRSKEETVRRYDHEVQGATAVRPLVGSANHGPSDAAVLVPLDTQANGSTRAAALSNGICPQYTDFDPYAMAWAAVDEAMRNLVAVGADPDQVALVDNFCWGNPKLPDRLGTLVRCTQGCYDAALAYNAPFISGKDSLNNEYTAADGQRHAIPGTLIISALGIVPDVRRTITSDLKNSGNLLYLVGETRDEFGGSHYSLIHGISGGTVPQPVPNALATMRALHRSISAGLVQSCHDCSEGGFAVTLAEMCIGGQIGAHIEIGPEFNAATLLYAESLSRFVVEVRPEDCEAFEIQLESSPFTRLGIVSNDGRLQVIAGTQTLLALDVAVLETAWRGETSAPVSINEPLTQTRVLPRTVRTARSGKKRVLILHANGSNRDRDVATACELVGAESEIVHINQLLAGERHLADYHMLILPGGFSYGDDLGAGKLWALSLEHNLHEAMNRFVNEGRPVLGICNGFQALVKSGLLPGEQRNITLTYNESARFECRWVYLQANLNSPCLFTEGLTEPIYCPVAHGEGRIVAADDAALNTVLLDNLNALSYINADASSASYPANPNGSLRGIAGLCNRAGNVLGLMPHPENHIFPWQHPNWRRGQGGMDGLRLFQNGIKYA